MAKVDFKDLDLEETRAWVSHRPITRL